MTSKLDKIVDARMRLKQRFEARMHAARSSQPLGSGPPNRHGMPKLPVEQTESKKWPVLDLGMTPLVAPAEWRLTVDGAVETPLELGWNDFLALEQVEDTSDFHCVTGWSRFDIAWQGVRFADLAARAMPREDATHVMCHAYDGYSTNVPLEDALQPDVLLVHRADGGPLPVEHGGPVRMITPRLYAWKGAKWIRRIELMAGDRPGFWEQRGYSNTARPWDNDRYG